MCYLVGITLSAADCHCEWPDHASSKLFQGYGHTATSSRWVCYMSKRNAVGLKLIAIGSAISY